MFNSYQGSCSAVCVTIKSPRRPWVPLPDSMIAGLFTMALVRPHAILYSYFIHPLSLSPSSSIDLNLPISQVFIELMMSRPIVNVYFSILPF